MTISTKIANYLQRSSWIRRMFEEGEKLRAIYGSENVYDFTLGNPEQEPPVAFKEELKRLALNPVPGMHRYMSNAGYEFVRQAIAEYLSQQSNLKFSSDHIVMTCGAGGGLNVVLKAILNPGEEVIVIRPFFVEYNFYIDNHQGVPVVVDSTPDFQPDPQAIVDAINERTKAIIINSPHNPTGVVYTQEQLEALAEVLRWGEKKFQRDIYLIGDEPYAKIIFEGVKLPNLFTIYHNTITVTSHSKDLALPGERIGYVAISPNCRYAADLFEALVFCNRTLGFVNAPALMQRLVAGLQHITVDVASYQERRDILYQHLTSLGFEVVKPMGAFYLFPRSPIEDDVEFVRLAQKHRILLVPGSGFGLSGYFRLAYCVDKQIILNSLPAFTALAAEVGLKH